MPHNTRDNLRGTEETKDLNKSVEKCFCQQVQVRGAEKMVNYRMEVVVLTNEKISRSSDIPGRASNEHPVTLSGSVF